MESAGKLLIVDDLPEMRMMLRLVLDYGKFHLLEAGDGATALALAQAEKPDVILLDVMMPGSMDGIDVCRAIKSDPALAGSYVVLLTALGEGADYARGDAAGADAYLVKPVSPDKLIEVVEMRKRLKGPVRSYGQ
jgi:CheY-like chemotaxis protein